MPKLKLDSARIKIERAKYHIGDLDRRVRVFSDSDPCEIYSEQDPQTGDCVYKVKSLRPIPPEIACIIGDAIHNLRSALDHLACGLVKANDGVLTRRTAFPIFDSAAQYKAQSPAKVKGMSGSAVRGIDALEPYAGGNEDLWLLHDLDITDKHKLLLTCISGHLSWVIAHRFAGDPPFPPFDLSHLLRPPILASTRLPMLERGAEISRTSAAQNVDTQVKVVIEVAFGEPGILRGRPVLPFLHQLAQLVSGIIESFAGAH
jgi:hypothetical protein